MKDEVFNTIKLVYEDLSKNELLERCVGGYTQNNNVLMQLFDQSLQKALQAAKKSSISALILLFAFLMMV